MALPGVEFYRAVGAVVLNPDTKGINWLTANCLVAGDTYVPYILSPDLRQDDKPRVDKPMVIPTGAVVYRSALSAPGVKRLLLVLSLFQLQLECPSVTITADAEGYYP